jgi:serine/threonine protein kinase/WD40 repeat protein
MANPPTQLPGADFYMAALWDAAREPTITIAGYTIMSEISRGGMGVVYHALQLRPEREVALKVLLPHLAEEPEMLARFQLEARAMAALDHPGILPVFEVGEADGVPFFSMKLATGGSLSERLQRKSLPPKEAATLMIQLTRALHHAHQHGVLHRDLKPGNFLFLEDGRACVSDFGLAKLTVADHGPLTRTESFFGTPHYMPPEVAAGSANDSTVAGDLYSMGAVFYECLTGRRPHEVKDNVAALLRSIADDPVTPPSVLNPSLPKDLSIICMKSLERNPRDRYASVGDFADDIERWTEGRLIKARPAGKLEIAWRWTQRHPLSAGLVAALLVVSIVGTVLLAVSHGERGAALREARQQLHRSLIKEARNERLLGSPGHRDRALAELRQATRLTRSPEIRDEAAALLARPDLAELPMTKNPPASVWSPGRMPDDPASTWKIAKGETFALVTHESGIVRLWKKDVATPIKQWEPPPENEIVGEFTPDGASVVLSGTDNGIIIESLTDLAPARVLAPPGGPLVRFLSIDPTGRRVALARVDGLEVIDLKTAKDSWHFGEAQARCPAAWSSDGSAVAVAVGDRREAVILEAENGGICTTATVTGSPQHLAFHPNRTLIAIASDDDSIAVCESATGTAWTTLHFPANSLKFSPDGKKLEATDDSGLIHEWSVMLPVAFHEWQEPLRNKADFTVFNMELSPDGTHLLTVSAGCIAIWSLAGERQTGYHMLENQRNDVTASAWWLSDKEILLQIPGGLERLQIDEDGKPGESLRVKKVPGSRVITVRPDGGWVVSVSNDEEKTSYEVWPGGNSEQASPTAEPAAPLKTPATTDLQGQTATLTTGEIIKVRRADGTLMRLIPPLNPGVRALVFSRDGHRLMVLTRLHRVFSWDLTGLSTALDDSGF